MVVDMGDFVEVQGCFSMFQGTGLTVILKVVSFLVLMTLSSMVSGWDRLIILLKEAVNKKHYEAVKDEITMLWVYIHDPLKDQP